MIAEIFRVDLALGGFYWADWAGATPMACAAHDSSFCFGVARRPSSGRGQFAWVKIKPPVLPGDDEPVSLRACW